MTNRIWILIATFFGAGKLPKAPGTWGSLAALPFAAFAMKAPPFFYMACCFAVVVIGVLASQVYENHSKKHDSSEIVIDEVAGIFISLTWLPLTWQTLVAGFFLFRLFDVWKPYPISLIDEKVEGGVGVMADDLAAGLIVNVILQIIFQNTDWLGVMSNGGIGG